MKTKMISAVLLLIGTVGIAQKMDKKYKSIEVEIEINAPAEKVWNTMVKDYGAISNWSPYIYAASCENGSLQGVEGAERKCDLNENGSRWVHERIASIDDRKMEMRNIILDGAKFPLDKENTQAYYRVKDNGNGTSKASYLMEFRGKPAIMTGMMKGSFKKSLENNLKGLKHYVETGEEVTPANDRIKGIKDLYRVNHISK
ncbi:MAG: SRPBCC family protein [Cyclobacteriaceae bacterium]|nr:SRPBCC family protein [Cyclobacteriaceae bacterium HetDA_MAG_MS6]